MPQAPLPAARTPPPDPGTLTSSISAYNVAADVTGLVKLKLDATPPGRLDFAVSEADPTLMDGDIS